MASSISSNSCHIDLNIHGNLDTILQKFFIFVYEFILWEASTAFYEFHAASANWNLFLLTSNILIMMYDR